MPYFQWRRTAKAAKDWMVFFASGAAVFALLCLNHYRSARQRIPSKPEASFGDFFGNMEKQLAELIKNCKIH